MPLRACAARGTCWRKSDLSGGLLGARGEAASERLNGNWTSSAMPGEQVPPAAPSSSSSGHPGGAPGRRPAETQAMDHRWYGG